MNRRFFITATTAALASPSIVRAQQEVMRLRDFYVPGASLSDLALEHEGKPVRVAGYMAPPLKADSKFFVLTTQPMAVCPFCTTEAEWPEDIMAVYTKRTFLVVAFTRKIETSGILSLGPYRDPDTGFLSMVRIENARFETA